MSAPSLVLAFALAVSGVPSFAQVTAPAAPGSPVSPVSPGAQGAPATAPQATRDARLARWKESLELDLPGEVLEDGRARVAPGGELADDARALALFARALASTGRRDEARRLLEGAARATPAEYVTAERARLLLEDDELEGALDLLCDRGAKALREPATAEAHWIAGRAYARLGAWDRAVPHFEHFVEQAPYAAEAASAWHQLAQAALQRGDNARAQVCATREDALGRWHAFYRVRRLQIREQPKEPLPRLGLAQLLLEADDKRGARQVLDELLLLAPEFAPAWLAQGELQRKLEDLKGARASYDRALELDPTLAVARMNRAVIARVEGRDADARTDLEVLLAGAEGKDPRFAGAHLELARLFARRGERERAAASYARYRELGGKEPL